MWSKKTTCARPLLKWRSHELVALRHHDDPVGDGEAARVRFRVVADLGVRRHVHVLVDDGAANAAVASDVDAVEDDRLLDVGEAVDAHLGRQHRAIDPSARNDAALDYARVGGAPNARVPDTV